MIAEDVIVRLKFLFDNACVYSPCGGCVLLGCSCGLDTRADTKNKTSVWVAVTQDISE